MKQELPKHRKQTKHKYVGLRQRWLAVRHEYRLPQLEKQRSWSDCHGDVETRFSKDDLLTTIMIYWVTQSYGTSARYYYEAAHNPWTPAHDRMPVFEAQVGISVLPEEICSAPSRWAQRYYNLKQWRHHANGGHFAAWEEPPAIITDVRDLFRVLS